MQDLSIVIPWILSVAAIGVGIWQYADKKAQSNREPFLRMQLKISFEASEIAARLATETDPERWEEARKAFWRLYWGTLGIVENREVEAAMVALGNLVPAHPGAPAELPMEALQIPSLTLAHKTRDLVLNSWDVHLEPLRGRQ